MMKQLVELMELLDKNENCNMGKEKIGYKEGKGSLYWLMICQVWGQICILGLPLLSVVITSSVTYINEKKCILGMSDISSRGEKCSWYRWSLIVSHVEKQMQIQRTANGDNQ